MNVVINAAKRDGIFIEVDGAGNLTGIIPSGVLTFTKLSFTLDDSIAYTLANSNKIIKKITITSEENTNPINLNINLLLSV